MAITNLKVSNFKSFKDLDLNLGPTPPENQTSSRYSGF